MANGGGGETNFTNGVLENGEMMEGISAVCWNELLMQHFVKLFQF